MLTMNVTKWNFTLYGVSVIYIGLEKQVNLGDFKAHVLI